MVQGFITTVEKSVQFEMYGFFPGYFGECSQLQLAATETGESEVVENRDHL